MQDVGIALVGWGRDWRVVGTLLGCFLLLILWMWVSMLE